MGLKGNPSPPKCHLKNCDILNVKHQYSYVNYL